MDRVAASAVLQLLFDDPVQSGADLFDVHPIDQRLLLLDAVHHAFQDVGRIEDWRERARREILERPYELEDVIHGSVYPADLVELPIPEGVRGDIGALEW